MTITRKRMPAFPVPQTRTDAEKLAVELGEKMRESSRLASAAADEIVKIKLALKQQTDPIEQLIKKQWSTLATYCQAHREELCPDGKKSVSIAAGIIGWRLGNKTVSIEEGFTEEQVIEALEEAELDHLLRQKTELDKPAILAAGDNALTGIGGLVIDQVEQFFFKPLELETEKVKATARVSASAGAEAA